MSTLQDTISDHRPNPLSEAVQVAAASPDGTRNISTVADQLGVMACPKEALPPALRKAREALEELDRLKSESENAVRQEMAEWQRYDAARSTIAEQRAQLANGEALLARLKQSSLDLPAFFRAQFGNQPLGVLLARITDDLAVREAAKMMPSALTALRARIVKGESEIAAMEKEHGFKPPTAAAPQSPQVESEHIYDTPAAFREEQRV